MILDEPVLTSALMADVLRSPQLPAGAFVEIGTGMNSSTLLAGFAIERERRFATVDISIRNYLWARKNLYGKPGCQAARMTGQRFLRRSKGPIAFIYMDNYDWVDSAADPSGDYPSGLSKRESELVHLEQSLLLETRVPPSGVVLFDDTWFLEKQPPGEHVLKERPDFKSLDSNQILQRYEVFGKGSVAVPFLMCCGFQVVAVSQRPHWTQILLIRDAANFRALYPPSYFSNLLAEHRAKTYPTGKLGQLARRPAPAVRRTLKAAYLRLPSRLQAVVKRVVR